MELLRFSANPTGAVAAVDGVATVAGTVAPLGREFTRNGEKYRFTALQPAEPLNTVKLLVEHDPERPVGYATHAGTDPEGLHMAFAVPDVPATADALDNLRHSLRDGLSVGVEITDRHADPDTGVVDLTGTVREVSLVTVPQFNDSRAALAAGAAPALATFTTGDTMPTMPTVESATESFSVSDAPEFLELATRVADLEAGAGAPASPLAAFDSFADLIRAGLQADPDAGRIALALADNTFNGGANAGVNPPAWLQTVYGIVERRRPAINAFGGPVGLGDAGMSVSWPYYDGDLSTLVGEQATQKAEITSGVVDIKAATEAIKTYAGGADNALQLIERSSPSFLEAWGRIMVAAYALITENAFENAVHDGAAGSIVFALPPADLAGLKGFLFDASDMVEDATGAPASFALASPSTFKAIAGLDGIENPAYGTVNAGGEASAATLRVEVHGLPILKARGLTGEALVVSNPDAAGFGEDGPSFIDALNVTKLGRDTAIYGYGASMVHVPAGIVKAVAAGAQTAGAGKK